MTGRIFRSICLVATGVLLAALVLIMGVLYSYYTNIQRDQLADETLFAAQGYEQSGLSFFDGLNIDVRVTLIAADGRVIYDSESDVSAMENHAEREEVAEAFESGEGEATRTSSTITTAQMYFAKRLSDGNVIRLSTTQYTFVTLTMSMLHPLIIIMLGAIICALVLASGLSKKIVEPLNTVNLDEPLKNEGYDELAPLLRKIDAQQKKIRTQKLELLQRKKEFAAVTDKMSEGLILLGTSGHIISINRAASFLLGTSADCEGSELVFICRKPKLNMLVDEAKSGRRAEQIAELNGREYKFTANPVFSDDEVSGIVLLILDVTENVDAERMRREFTANVSHELKTPLQTISGCAELLANGIVKTDDIPQFSRQIYGEAQRMISLVQDIISLSHLDEGAEDMQRAEFDLYAICTDVVRELRAQADAASVSLTLSGESIRFMGIPQLASVLVRNLCDNAIKYNREGGSVKISLVNENGEAVLRVADTGIGIPKDDRERIFERFYRVDKSRSKKVGGTGLGLSIVKHAAKLHNARISLESETDIGTTVTVHFPIK
ncbi:MAG: PAS domain-containing sensor histidine kinase [Clostridia bacterium]|nr:PAS domain-containing sensor histidine kinase [Clostridia bacterium]